MSDMTALVYLLVIGLVFAVAWNWLNRNRNPRAKLGPDGTNVREPETFVVHHEGKGQGLDIANTALKERTENLSRDLPGEGHEVHAPVPGRDLVRLSDPPSDVSRYGDEKVAPGATPGQPGAETKEKVLMEGPKGSRPATPEEPGSPYAKGRRVTDNHRDVELAADLLPATEPGQKRRLGRDMAATPTDDGHEPGYGLGKTAAGHGRVVMFRGRLDRQAKAGAEAEETEIAFNPDPDWAEMGEDLDWSPLFEEVALPPNWGEDATVVMVRNPRSLYVYWERAGYGDENLRATLGEAEFNRTIPCLRVYDVASGAWPGQPGSRVFSIDVNDFADHWFVNDGVEPGCEYIVSYGRRTPDGRYYLLSHSVPVRTPQEAPAPESLARAGMLYQYYVRQPGGGQTGQDPHHPGSQWR
jgi:hypothetical protein